MAVPICGLFDYGYLYVEVSAQDVVFGVYLLDIGYEVENIFEGEGRWRVLAIVAISL